MSIEDPDRFVRVPESLMKRADAAVEPLKAATLGAARWSTTAVVRLALDWGLSVIEAQLKAGAPLVPPAGPVRGVGVGDEVRFRDGVNDSDGRVLEVAPGGRCLVAWDSGVKLWHDADEVADWVAAGFVHAAG
jgi:hypothetical protein